jgi:hypothetical protein
MDILDLVICIIILVYFASWVITFREKKFEGLFKKVWKIINLTAFFLTVGLILLWSFNIHLNILSVETIPFWLFIISSLILFGLTETRDIERTFYGLIFYGNLYLSLLMVIPFLGLGIISKVYSPFNPDLIHYQDANIIVTDEMGGFMAPKPSPTVYLKCGLFLHKFKTSLPPVYTVDSVSIVKIDQHTIEIEIHGDSQSSSQHNKQIINCNCFENNDLNPTTHTKTKFP